MAQVTVEYKDGKKIVTLPSGEKREHTKESLTSAKEVFSRRRDKLNEQIALIDDDIKKIG